MNQLKFWISLILLSGLYLPVAAHDEPSYYLQGTLGNRSVGVQIDHFEEVTYLKYYFEEEKFNHYLKGDAHDQEFEFEGLIRNQNIPQKIHLKHLSNDTWKGIRISSGDTLDLHLLPIVTPLLTHELVDQDSIPGMTPYGFLRTSDLQLTPVKTSRIRGYKLQWLSDPFSGIQFFQVVKAPKGIDIHPINRYLMDIHLWHIDQFFECGTFGFAGQYRISTQIHLLNESFLSFEVKTLAGCFSERLSEKADYYTLQIPSAKVLTLEEFLFFEEGDPPRPNSREWFIYRREVFGPKIVNLLESSHAHKDQETSSCEWHNPKAWQLPSWYLKKDGLYLEPHLALMTQSCNQQNWPIIPYHHLKDYLQKQP